MGCPCYANRKESMSGTPNILGPERPLDEADMTPEQLLAHDVAFTLGVVGPEPQPPQYLASVVNGAVHLSPAAADGIAGFTADPSTQVDGVGMAQQSADYQ